MRRMRQASGVRDRAILHLAFAAGLRVSELVSLRVDQVGRQAVSSTHVMGKGRRERVLPLWKAAALKAWLAVRPMSGDAELFLNAAGRAMTRSGFEYILAKHVATAAQRLPSLRADPTEALAAMAPPSLTPGRLRAPDDLLAMLKAISRSATRGKAVVLAISLTNICNYPAAPNASIRPACRQVLSPRALRCGSTKRLQQFVSCQPNEPIVVIYPLCGQVQD